MFAVILFSTTSIFAMGEKEEIIDTTGFNVYYGRIVDGSNGRTLPFATVEVVGSNVATVSNIDGDFTIKIAREASQTELKISYIGFSNKIVALNSFKGSRTKAISLTPTAVQLEEITIRPEDALKLIGQTLANIKNNYSQDPMMMRGFYRETVQRGRNYASISEAVVDIYKSGYTNSFSSDQVKLFKGRKSADVEKMDTVLFKLQGGPSTAVLLDVVKNPYILLSVEYAEIYDFYLSDVISIDDQLHYVVSFHQKSHVAEPFYFGKLYIDMEKLAITEAEFELNMENKEEAARLFIQRKPLGMSIIPEKAVYRTKYTIEDNRWYLQLCKGRGKIQS